MTVGPSNHSRLSVEDQGHAAPMSRRVFMASSAIAAGAFPLLAAGSAHAQMQSPPAPPPSTTPQAPSNPSPPTPPASQVADDESASLAAQTDNEQHMTISVGVNGQGPYKFVVDTGSERSVLSDTVVKALGLVPKGKATVDGIVRKVSSDLVEVRELSFGPFKRAKLVLPVLPRYDLKAEGFLGLDAIKGSRVTLDFRNGVVRIEEPRAGLPAFEDDGQVIVVHAFGPAGRLRSTDCTIDGVRTTVFIDTGAQISVGNPALELALKRNNPLLRDMGAIGIQGVTGGEVMGRAIPVKDIRMRNLSFARGIVVVADVNIFNEWDLTKKPALLLGMDFLRQFGGVSIDYRKKEILFEMSMLTGVPASLTRIGGAA